jgi:hypothetical protein
LKGKHFGPWSPWYALNHILRLDLQRMKDGGMGVLSELDIDSEVVLRCFRTGGTTHAGDRQLVYGFASYLIDVHKRKNNLRGKQGKESTRETHDSQPSVPPLTSVARLMPARADAITGPSLEPAPQKQLKSQKKNSKHPWSRPKRGGAEHPTSVAQLGVGGL